MKIPASNNDVVTLLGPPYREFLRVDPATPLQPIEGGWVMTWNMGLDRWEEGGDVAISRRAGIPLTIILPDRNQSKAIAQILRTLERARPQAVLPHHVSPCPGEVACVIRRSPTSLASSVAEYLEWRGFKVDPVTRRIIRRTIELSAHIQTVSALAKNLYMSRRALGRRLMSDGLPVPSHWLSIARILRAAIKLQNTDKSLFHVAISLGYQDGFALSNQMRRTCAIRPLEVKEKVGWEWVFERWLTMESDSGNISSSVLKARPSIVAPELQHPGTEHISHQAAVFSS